MATKETPVSKENLDEKLGDLKLEEPEKFEDTTEAPPEESKEAVLEELKDSPPKLHHVETEDTTDPAGKPPTEDGVVKGEVPEAFEEELKKDHDIVPPKKEEKPTENVGSVAKETGPEGGESAPPTRDVPVEVTHKDVDKKPVSKPSFGDKITTTIHKIVHKD